MEMEICGLGNALMDIVVHLDSDHIFEPLHLTKGIMHLIDEERWHHIFHHVQDFPHSTHPGGSCANAIATAALLGANAAFCGQVGADRFGVLYRDALHHLCGIHFIHLLEGGHTGKCLSLISPDAERTMLTTLGCAMEMDAQYLFRPVLHQARYFHVTGYALVGSQMAQTAMEALETARQNQVKISFDVADPWVVASHRSLIWDVIERYADIVFTNREEARVLCDCDAEEAADLLSKQCDIAVVKMGALGSIIASQGQRIGVDAHPVTPVDSTGAGDAYAGAFLYALAKGHSLQQAGRLASRVAAETVAQTGAVVSTPGKLQKIAEGF